MHAEAPRPCAVLRGACAVLCEASRGDAGSESTTAGSTPEPPGAFAFCGAPREGVPREGAGALAPAAAQGANRQRPLSRQVRKLFVGGVPQEMNEGELQGLFAEHAPVERVWLQRHRGDKQRKQHRGFGYVVFCEPDAVDSLLGGQFSRFLEGEGFRLEAKRALSNLEIQSGLPWSPEPRPPPDVGVVSPCPSQPWQRCLAWNPKDWDLGPRRQGPTPDRGPPCLQPFAEDGLASTPPLAQMVGLLAPECLGEPGAPHALLPPLPERPAHLGAMVALCAAAHGGPEALERALREATPDHYED